MQLRGIASASVAARVPVDCEDIEQWVAAGRDMPRRSEGLNDPWRLSTVAHFTLMALQAHRNIVAKSAESQIDALFDHRAAALDIAPDEILALMPIWREMQSAQPHAGLPKIQVVSDLLTDLIRKADTDIGRTVSIVDPLGRSIHFASGRSASWLAAVAFPKVIRHIGLTKNLMPHFVPPLRLLRERRRFDDTLEKFLLQQAKIGSDELDRLERCIAAEVSIPRTVRSRLDRAAAFRLAFPSITGARLATALGTTPQGGSYLLRQLAAA